MHLRHLKSADHQTTHHHPTGRGIPKWMLTNGKGGDRAITGIQYKLYNDASARNFHR